MRELLIQLLLSFRYGVYLQGSMDQEEEYPDSFFTFWNPDNYDGSHYNNKAVEWVWVFEVNFYSNNPALVESELLRAKQLLTENGFVISGKGHDSPSDEPTHTGRGFTALIVERNEV